jgi:hypothetical protein
VDLLLQVGLLPALAATLPGLWVWHRGRPAWGISLAVVGFFLISLVAIVAIAIGFVTQSILPAAAALWGAVAFYCLVAVVIGGRDGDLRR